MRPLEGLDDLPWADLEHAGGTAEDVPDMLWAMASPDPSIAQRAAGESISLCREATVFSATAAAIPFVIELASAPEVHVRGELMGLCAVAAVSEGETELRPHGVRRALAREVDALVGLAADPEDWTIRMLAATTVGNCDPPPAAAGVRLMALFREEPEPAVRAALVASAVTCEPHQGAAWIGEAFGDPDPGVRAAGVFALARGGLPWSGDALTTLHDSLAEGDPFTDLPWVWTLDGLTSTICCLGPDTGWEVLEHLLASPLATVRTTAIDTVRRVLWEDPDAEPRARQSLTTVLADDDDAVRNRAEELIALLDGDMDDDLDGDDED